MSKKTIIVATVALASISAAWLTGCGASGPNAGDQDFSGTSATPTPPDVRNLQSDTQLTVPDPSFTAGSWSPGIIYDASGFDPGSQITIAVAAFDDVSPFSRASHAQQPVLSRVARATTLSPYGGWPRRRRTPFDRVDIRLGHVRRVRIIVPAQ